MSEMESRQVLVTGAAGFVGRALCAELRACGHVVVGAVRHGADLSGDVAIGEIGPSTDWRAMLYGCRRVVHLAARVHETQETERDAGATYRRINTDATLNLARQAAEAGVKRFVFVSTVKVNGEGRDAAYREADAPAPADAYAMSKWEAEQGLWRIARETGLEVVVLRPPLVYGPGVKANFRHLLDAVARGWPLPFGAITNRRSLLYLGNLVDAIRVCLDHPAAAGQTFLVDDGSPVSTPELIRAVASAMARPARLLPAPVAVLAFAGALLGKRAAVARLTDSLLLDSALIRTRLGWSPPYSMESGLAATVADLK